MTISPPRLYALQSSADIVQILLDFEGVCRVRDLIEASVYKPVRGHVWVAVFAGPEPGKQVWRTTGLRDYDAALAVAKAWESEARAQRLGRKMGQQPAALRVRRRPQSAPRPNSGGLTQAEVAALLKLSQRAVRDIEKRAIAKLRAHPLLREIWTDYLASKVDETRMELDNDGSLTALDILALLDLAQTQSEREAVWHVFHLLEPKTVK
jgi:hypothetical protein